MTEEIKSLIEKINREGIQQAEKKASEIQQQAIAQAAEIMARAKKEAEKLIADAQEKLSRMQEKQGQLLAQAGRDLILSLKKEIQDTLEKIILQDVRQALSPEAMYRILLEAIKNYSGQLKDNIIVSVKQEDAEALEDRYLAKLKEETKKGIVLEPCGEISGGFSISFDAGRSQFDFTDQALADYIGTYLKPQLKEILKEAASA